jgi:alcohol dehydrogenase
MPFRVPTRLTLEPGCLARLGEAAVACGGRRWMVVVDPGLAATPWPERARAHLEAAGVEASLFDRVEANPRDTTVERLAEAMREAASEGVVGLGGGSVLDAAKAAAMVATNGGRLRDYEGRNRYREHPLPMIAVPTTCGTGSEVTWVSVVTVPEARAKVSVKGETMFPAVALVDADLVASLPAHLVAWTALDALTHALEATTGRLANPASDALAERAITLVCRFLPRAVADVAGDREAREAVVVAATLAGLAFGNADVAAVHCLSETLGGLYDLPHGLANAVLLVPVLGSHGEAVAPRLAALAHAVLGAGAGGGGAGRDPRQETARVLAALAELVGSLGLPPFSSFGIPAADFPEIARRAVANNSNPSNPRPMGEAEYLGILAGLAG